MSKCLWTRDHAHEDEQCPIAYDTACGAFLTYAAINFTIFRYCPHCGGLITLEPTPPGAVERAFTVVKI